MGQQFMTPGEHFDKLVLQLNDADRERYQAMTHSRAEVGYRNRNFVVYEVVRREPVVIDNIKVLDFMADDQIGATCELRSEELGKTITVGYLPERLFGYNVFIHLPLHSKIRWSTTPDDPRGGNLAFDLVIRTKSRYHLRERGITYFETGIGFAREFENKS